MTELSFLLDLLLNHKLPKPTREAVTARIKDVEARLTQSSQPLQRAPAPLQTLGNVPPHLVGQSASTIAAMMRHEQNVPAPPLDAPTINMVSQQPSVAPVQQIAHTPAAQAAMADRQAALAGAISGKPAPGRTSPRKF